MENKKTKSFVVRLLTIVCALCCCLSLVFGLVACKDDAKGIKSTAIVNGHLIITYTDGSTADVGPVDGSGVDGVCEHNYVLVKENEKPEVIDNPETEEVEAYLAEICSYDVYACTKCESVKADITEHDDKEITRTEPTCYAEGYEGYQCKNEGCNYKHDGKVLEATGDHNLVAADEIVTGSQVAINKCITEWWDTPMVCTNDGCPYAELTRHDPLGHRFNEETIEVGTAPTLTKTGTLVADCLDCDATNVVIKELPKLSTEAYEYEVISTNDLTHTMKFTFVGDVTVNAGLVNEATFEVEEEISGNPAQYHVTSGGYVIDSTLKIDDFVAEEFAGVKLATGETLSCDEYADAGFFCALCDEIVYVEVKAPHVKDEFVAYKDEATNNPCENDHIQLWTCKNCDIASAEFANAALGHDWKLVSYVENEDDTVDVNLVCNRYPAHTLTIENVTEYEIKEPTCCEDGYFKYTVAGDAEPTTLPIGNDEAGHVIAQDAEGNALATAMIGQTINFTDAKYAAYIGKEIKKVATDTAFVCGTPVAHAFLCPVCEEFVGVNVLREHKKINEAPKVGFEATCSQPGWMEFNCEYEDCDKHTVKGEYEYGGAHDFTFVSYDSVTEKLLVKCSYNCTAGNIEIDYAAEDVKLTTFTCKEIKDSKATEAPKSNYNIYTFTYEDKIYSVKENVENYTHQLNGQFEEFKEARRLGNGIKLIAGSAPLDCTDTSATGGFLCECCDEIVQLPVKGDCVRTDEVTVNVEATCETDSKHYWVCKKCGTENIDTSIAVTKATGHKFEIVDGSVSIDTADYTKSTATAKCVNANCNIVGKAEVELKCTGLVETCDAKTYTFTATYKNGTYTQAVSLEYKVETGSHLYLYADGTFGEDKDLAKRFVWTETVDAEYEDGNPVEVKRVVTALYCGRENCKQLVIISIVPEDITPPVVVPAN